MAILVDTGVWVAAADTDEPRHAACAELLHRHRGDLLTPAPVVAETAWLIEARLGPTAEARFLRLVTTRQVRIVDLAVDDYQRCITLIDTYADLGLGLVDAPSSPSPKTWPSRPSPPSTTATSGSSAPATPTPSPSSPDPARESRQTTFSGCETGHHDHHTGQDTPSRSRPHTGRPHRRRRRRPGHRRRGRRPR